MSNIKSVAFIGAGALLSAGVIVGGAFAASAAAPKKVATKLTDFEIAPQPSSIAAGKVTFVAKNAGKVEHELVVIRTTKAAGKLGLANGEASEKGAKGEIEDIAAGKSKSLTLTLQKGHYVLLCNIAGHYEAGMRVNFTVK